MKKIVWILSIFLFSTVTIQAENNTTEQKLFEQNYQLQQQKEQIKELEEKLRKYADDKIEDSNKRIEIINGSVSRYTSALTWFGIIIALIGTLVTILLVGIAWSSRQNAILEAKNTSLKETKEFLNDFKQLAEEKLNTKLLGFESKADKQLKVFEKKYQEKLDKIKQDVKTTDENQDARNLFNKARMLNIETKDKEAIKAYDELIDKYKDSKNEFIQVQVAIAMFNKGVTLRNLNKSKEMIRVHEELIDKYKDSKNEVIQVQVAMSIMNKYESLIIEDQALSKEDKEWIETANFRSNDKAIFEMLDIINKAKKIPQDAEVAKWAEDYKDVQLNNWGFEELKEWITNSSYEDEIKNRISGYIDTFKKYFDRD